jgi:hypothetical protein
VSVDAISLRCWQQADVLLRAKHRAVACEGVPFRAPLGTWTRQAGLALSCPRYLCR